MDWMEANCCKCAQHFVEDETPRCQKGYLGPNFYEWPEGWSGEQDDVNCRDFEPLPVYHIAGFTVEQGVLHTTRRWDATPWMLEHCANCEEYIPEIDEVQCRANRRMDFFDPDKTAEILGAYGGCPEERVRPVEPDLCSACVEQAEIEEAHRG